MRFSYSILILLALLILPVAAQDGWDSFRQNRWAEAKTAFQGSDPLALRGQAWIASLEGDEASEAGLWSRFMLANPGDKTTLAVWPMFISSASASGQDDLIQSTARSLAENPQALPEVRASARSVLAEQAGTEASAQLGYVQSWKIIGPFDNVSKSGLEKIFPPEQSLDLTRSIPGQSKRLVSWHDLPGTRVGSCSPVRYLGDDYGQVYYAATAIQGTAGPAWMRIDPSGACRVWLNGKRVFDCPVYGSSYTSVADLYAVPVELRDGWNTLLVKVCSDEDSYEADFRIRFTAPDGDASLSLVTDSSQVDPAGVQAGGAPPCPLRPMVMLEGCTAPDADLLRADVLLRHGGATEARAILKKALVAWPNWAILHWYLTGALAKEGHRDEARAEREKARALAPMLLSAELASLREQSDQGHLESALAGLRKLTARAPAHLGARGALYLALLKANLNEDALREMLGLLKVAPSADNYALAVELCQLQDRGAEADKLLAQGLQLHPRNEKLLSLQAEMAADKGDVLQALGLYQELARLYPDSDYATELASLYRTLKDWKSAAASLEVARRYRPNDADLAETLGDAYRELGQVEKAKELYSEGIRLDPGLVDLREKLALVKGEKAVLELVGEPDVKPLISAAPTQEQYPDAPAVFLLDQGRVVLFPDMAVLRSYHAVVKVFDDAGVQRFAAIPLARLSRNSRVRLETARIYKPDGKIQDVREESSRSRINFPSLAPGDVLEYSFRVEDAPSGALANDFWEEWFVATHVPVRLSRYVLIAPTGLERLKIMGHGSGLPQPTVSQNGPWEIREWVVTEVPQARQHPLAAPQRDVGAWLEMSTIANWREVATWYADLSSPRCVPDEVLRQKALELTRSARTPEEKLRALQAYVARGIRYQTTPFRTSAFVPTEGKKVLDDRYGDCKDKSALLCAMLQAVGLKGKMVLLATRDEGIVTRLPAPYFNHAITLVELPGKTVWVDATADYQELSVLPIADQGVGALIVASDATGLSTTPVAQADEHKIRIASKASLTADGAAQGQLSMAFSGQPGAGLRAALLQIDRPTRDKALKKVVRSFLNPQITGTKTAIQNLEDPDRSVVAMIDWKAGHYSESAGKYLVVQPPFAYDREQLANLAQLLNQAGDQDLELSDELCVRSLTLDLSLPAGMAAELPKAVSQKLPFASYKVAYTAKGQKVTGVAELRLETMRLTPAEARQLAGLMESFNRAMSQPLLVLKK